MKSAIILGATGLTGGILLRKLLDDERYSKVKLFSRSPVGIEHPKLEEQLIDLFELSKYADTFIADEVYCCVGSTQKKTPDKEVYRKVDHGIPVSTAALAKKNNIATFLVISALGADPDSRFFYNKTKGEMERDVLKAKIFNPYIFQPSLITGNRKEKRTLESLSKEFMKFGNHLLVGSLKKYRSISAETIAEAMIYVANHGYPKVRIESNEIEQIVKESRDA